MATQREAVESFREYLQDIHSDGEFDLSEHGSTVTLPDSLCRIEVTGGIPSRFWANVLYTGNGENCAFSALMKWIRTTSTWQCVRVLDCPDAVDGMADRALRSISTSNSALREVERDEPETSIPEFVHRFVNRLNQLSPAERARASRMMRTSDPHIWNRSPISGLSEREGYRFSVLTAHTLTDHHLSIADVRFAYPSGVSVDAQIRIDLRDNAFHVLNAIRSESTNPALREAETSSRPTSISRLVIERINRAPEDLRRRAAAIFAGDQLTGMAESDLSRLFDEDLVLHVPRVDRRPSFTICTASLFRNPTPNTFGNRVSDFFFSVTPDGHFRITGRAPYGTEEPSLEDTGETSRSGLDSAREISVMIRGVDRISPLLNDSPYRVNVSPNNVPDWLTYDRSGLATGLLDTTAFTLDESSTDEDAGKLFVYSLGCLSPGRARHVAHPIPTGDSRPIDLRSSYSKYFKKVVIVTEAGFDDIEGQPLRQYPFEKIFKLEIHGTSKPGIYCISVLHTKSSGNPENKPKFKFRAIWHKGELPPIPPVVIKDSYAQSLEQWIEL